MKKINKYWHNDHGDLHREGGPAIEWGSGTKHWYWNGKLHRIDGAAIEFERGERQYFYMDKWYPEIKTDEEWKRFVKLKYLE